MKTGSRNWKPELEARRLNLLAQLGNGAPDRDSEFHAALASAAGKRGLDFLRGVKAYQHHPARRDIPEAPVIRTIGTTKLRDYNPTHPEAAVVVVIPSLINRFHILDLDLAPSFLRALAGRGFHPLVVDWDAPGAAEKDFGLEDYALRLAAIIDEMGAAKIHILGYCIGGLLALALAALRPERLKTMTLMATPWDFHRPDPESAAMFAALGEQMEPTFEQLGIMPVDMIQSLFASYQPLQSLQKFTGFAAMDSNSMEARHFVLLEDWLNDGVPLTAKVARECLGDWYGKNLTAAGAWRVAGHVIDPRMMSIPSYVTVPGRDHIVPPESALPLAKLLPQASLHEPMTGHVGMMASRRAPHQVWAPLFHWLDEHR